MRKVLLLTGFFTFAPLLLAITLIFLAYTGYQKNAHNLGSVFPSSRPVAYAAFPSTYPFFHDAIIQEDARIEVVRQFLALYHSPLEPFAQDIVKASDKYDIDFRLLPAIAMQESNACKKIPKGSKNCWGFGIYGGRVKRFASFTDAINAVAKTLGERYVGKGLQTPGEIMSKYTPSSNGSWARGVTQFMDQLQYPLGT